MSMLPCNNSLVQTDSHIRNFFNRINLSRLLKACNITKLDGASALQVFTFLYSLVFTKKNLVDALREADFEKDVVYRFVNTGRYHWHRLLVLVSNALLPWLDSLTSQEKVLIIDDSFYDRSRSKKVELLSWVRDHTDGRLKAGFRMLTVGWSDGRSFLPLFFSLLSSSDVTKRLVQPLCTDKRSLAHKRRQEAVKPMLEAAVDMIREVKRLGVKAKYVLFDSWYAWPTTIASVVKEGFQVICMVKKTTKVQYLCDDGQLRDVKQIYRTLRKKRGRAKILASAEVTVQTKSDGPIGKARLIFVRNRAKKGDWLALLTTDTHLPSEEVVRIYGKRWDIEVFFKCCKSHLRLVKELHSRSYDALVAHTTIVMIRYIMLSVMSRESSDDRTIGGMFYDCCDEMEDIKFCKALQLLLSKFRESIEIHFAETAQLINEIIANFIRTLPRPLLASLSY